MTSPAIVQPLAELAPEGGSQRLMIQQLHQMR